MGELEEHADDALLAVFCACRREDEGYKACIPRQYGLLRRR